MSKTLAELAVHVGGEVSGDAKCEISSVGTLEHAVPGQISFFSNRKYRRQLENTSASAVVLSPQDVDDFTGNAIVVREPYVAYAKIVSLLYDGDVAQPGIGSGTVIDETANVDASCSIGQNVVIEANVRIAKGVRVGAGSFIGQNATIGADSLLHANVTVCDDTVIGERAIVHPGAVIGSDGFGLANDNGQWIKVNQVGCVIVGSDVEIGSNTTIDRGAIDDTVIEDGVKLDNLIQIGHNVKIGAHTAIAGCTGISGSARIGKHCAIGGGVGIVGHLEITDNVTITGMSLVTRSITEPGVYSSGTPLEENKKWHKNFVRIKQLDEIARRVKRLEAKLADPGEQKE